MFEEEHVDVGEVYDLSTPIHAVFKFRNVGNNPITIESVTSPSLFSLGYMESKYPRNAIKPNETGIIEVFYHADEDSSRRIKKPVHVRCSDSNEIIKLTFQADFIPLKEYINSFGFEWYLTYTNGKYGATSKDGKILLAEEYDWIKGNSNGLIARKGTYHYFYDTTGRLLIKVEFDKLIFHNDFLEAKKDGVYAVYKKDGRCVIPFERQCRYLYGINDRNLGKGFYIESNKGYHALCKENGEEVFRFKNEFKAYYANDRFVIVSSNTKDDVSLYDIHGISKAHFVNQNKTEDSLVVYIEENGDIIATLHSEYNFRDRKKIGNIKDYIAPSRNPLR